MPNSKLRPIRTGVIQILSLSFMLVACTPNYSPDTYSSSSVQQASKVESGVLIGVRKVTISSDSAVATGTGAAAGGIAGSQVADGAVAALGALGGTVVGGIAGNAAGHTIQDTPGYEYIVRKSNGDLVSLTQADKIPLKVGEHVLLIQGTQARIVSDYTVPVDKAPDSSDLSASPDKPRSPNENKPDPSLPGASVTPPAKSKSEPAPAAPASGDAAPNTSDTAKPAASTQEVTPPTSSSHAATTPATKPDAQKQDAATQTDEKPTATTPAQAAEPK